MIRQFFDAVRNNSLDDCKALLNKHKNDLDVNAQRHGRSVLHYAAMRGSSELIQFLISKNANVNATSTKDFNESIVHCAAVNSNPVEVFRILESHNANFAARDTEGTNALHLLVGFDSVFNKYAKNIGQIVKLYKRPKL